MWQYLQIQFNLDSDVGIRCCVGKFLSPPASALSVLPPATSTSDLLAHLAQLPAPLLTQHLLFR